MRPERDVPAFSFYQGGAMAEYKVMVKEVTSVVWRDVQKAGQELTTEVNAHLSSGWEPQGGVASIEAGTSVYLLQALVKR
jgi:hypothetical protein